MVSANVKLGFLGILILAFAACTGDKKVYKSNCDDDKTFKRITFAHLMDSLPYYDKHFVEVSGEYQQDKGQSVLFDSVVVKQTVNKGLWIEFSPNCPLYLTGTKIGFFDYDYNNGKLTPVSSGKITLRGVIDTHNKGHLSAYKGSIEHISYVKL